MNTRTTGLDPDYRREPDTMRPYCCRCQKVIKTKKVRRVFVQPNGHLVVHPEDVRDGMEGFWELIGNDCARQIGIEYTV